MDRFQKREHPPFSSATPTHTDALKEKKSTIKFLQPFLLFSSCSAEEKKKKMKKKGVWRFFNLVRIVSQSSCQDDIPSEKKKES